MEGQSRLPVNTDNLRPHLNEEVLHAPEKLENHINYKPLGFQQTFGEMS